MPKIAILGAGAAGLTSAKAALEEEFSPTIFERLHRIGGTWGPDNAVQHEQGLAWPGMRTNISRHSGTFSNFPWPENTPDFPNTEQVYNYLLSYAEPLKPYIRYGCKVIRVIQHQTSWKILWENNGNISEEIFDAVIVATGKFSRPYIPNLPGLNSIPEKNKLHSSQYRSSKTFTGQRMLVIGGSFSGTSIAAELSQEPTITVTHLFRQSRWITSRNVPSGPNHDGPVLPRDIASSYTQIQQHLSSNEQYKAMSLLYSTQNKFPALEMNEKTPFGLAIDDGYMDQVALNMLTPMRGVIAQFVGNKAYLKEGHVIEFDKVIFCTGYEATFPFLSEALQSTARSYDLYKDIFPIGVPGLAFVADYAGPRGAAFPLKELQARVACRALSGKLPLPTDSDMQQDIATKPKVRDPIEFMNELAEMIGAFPRPHSPNSQLILSQGTFTPWRYRLTGDHPYPFAKQQMEKTEAYRQQKMSK